MCISIIHIDAISDFAGKEEIYAGFVLSMNHEGDNLSNLFIVDHKAVHAQTRQRPDKVPWMWMRHHDDGDWAICDPSIN